MHSVNRLQLAVIKVADEIKKLNKFVDWRFFYERDLFYELVACILGSRVRFEHAQFFTDQLHRHGLLNIKRLNNDLKTLELNISDVLSRPLYLNTDISSKKQKYRYPNLKANHIRKTIESIYGEGLSLKKVLHNCKDPYEARYHLANYATGIGPKQASLFLRNIGYADDLAILDSHVLRYMSILQLISPTQNQVSNFKGYEKIEKTLQDYNDSLRTKLAHLDTSIWIVMRVYQEEFI
jgi:N-glycosylase/DNA lyase